MLKGDKMELNSKLSGILASLGIILITAGVAAFLFQAWDSIALTTKCALIVGYGTIMYVLSLYISRKKIYPEISATLLITAVGMMLWGIEVYNDFRIHPALASMRIFESTLVLILFCVSWYIGRQTVSLVGAIIATQALYLAIIAFTFNTMQFSYTSLAMAIIFIEFSYVVQRFSSSLAYWLRLIGSLLMGISLYALGDWSIWGNQAASFFLYDEIMWQICWPIVGIIFVYLGLKLRDNAFFIGGMASIIGVIFSVATTYARSMLGLPVTLILFGIISMSVSYGMLHLKNKVG